MQVEEAALTDVKRSLWQALSAQGEVSEGRTRLWVEDRLHKERAGIEEALQRSQAHSGIVRTLLNEAVKAVSTELDVLRTESRGRDVALEDLLDERVTGIEARMSEVDNRAAKKRRLSDLGNATEVRIEVVERQLRKVRTLLLWY